MSSFESGVGSSSPEDPCVYNLYIEKLRELGLRVYTDRFAEFNEPQEYLALVFDDETYQRALDILNQRMTEKCKAPGKSFEPITELSAQDYAIQPLARWGSTPTEALLRAISAWENYSSLYETLIRQLKQKGLLLYTIEPKDGDEHFDKYFTLVIDPSEHQRRLENINATIIKIWANKTKGAPKPQTDLDEDDVLMHELTRCDPTREQALLNAISAWESCQPQDITPPPKHSEPE